MGLAAASIFSTAISPKRRTMHRATWMICARSPSASIERRKMMTITQAINKAREDVSLVSFGDQYVVQTWSAKHNATWQMHPMDWGRAKVSLRANRIQYALECLGWQHDDA